MKGFNIFVVILFAVFACEAQVAEPRSDSQSEDKAFASFGDKISMEKAETSAQILQRFGSMKVSDTVQTKFTAIVKEVCKVKGCWMTLELPSGEESMVRFKDYGFFMPTDIEGKEVTLEGLAYVEEMSVADQKHFAKDGGMPQEQIDAISKPKMTYGFEANGVLVKK